MKVLAVIPARAGSKGIPNKNIRIVAGHPLVYYSINNAKNSKYITDIIVSTDSTEVKIIAHQMGVKCKWRNKLLCKDEVTLDAVIEDAVPWNENWDYIITLQPTSPTLSCKTLDAAIEYAVTNHFDTIISAYNSPHLSWKEINGKKFPNYEKRLNRQFLPPNYVETGAFMISKAEIVTATTRIGTKVDIFEVPEKEAQDIDTFSDLQYASLILESPKVAFYVNGNNARGMGHIYRTLELADEFYTSPDIYYDINQTDPLVFGHTAYKLIPVNGISALFERCKQEQYSIFINDILSTNIDYMIGLRLALPKAKIINFEDDGEGAVKADLVFNALYHNSMFSHVYSGEKYYISGKLFMFYQPIQINNNVKNVFISFGGADPQNYTDRMLKIISQDRYNNYHFIVVLGRAKYNTEELMNYNSYPNIEVLYDISNMPEIMSKCDIGITSRGRTGYELAILGIPSIAMAQNSREEKHGFVSNENGFTYIGLNPDDEIIEGNLNMYLISTQKTRQNFQKKLLKHDLRGGRKRVMALINNL